MIKKVKHSFISDPALASFRPKKQLGQNFLVDPNVKGKLLSSCNLNDDETVLEIGAGLGALTFELAKRVKSVIAIETDKMLAQYLQEKFLDTNVTVIHADFLKYTIKSLPKDLKVIGNLPYYISTPIIERIITNPDHFNSLFITIQNELGERIMAKKDTKKYGAFTCFVQYYSQPRKLFRIKDTAFRPIPKVHSCFLELITDKSQHSLAKNEELLFIIIQKAFQQRRKKIVNSLSAIIQQEVLLDILKNLNIDPFKRAENISLHNYIDIANQWPKL